MPDDLQERSGASPEHVQVPSVRIAPEPLLHQQRQALLPLRMSVWPIAIHTRASDGITAPPSAPRPPRPAMPS